MRLGLEMLGLLISPRVGPRASSLTLSNRLDTLLFHKLCFTHFCDLNLVSNVCLCVKNPNCAENFLESHPHPKGCLAWPPPPVASPAFPAALDSVCGRDVAVWGARWVRGRVLRHLCPVR